MKKTFKKVTIKFKNSVVSISIKSYNLITISQVKYKLFKIRHFNAVFNPINHEEDIMSTNTQFSYQ